MRSVRAPQHHHSWKPLVRPAVAGLVALALALAAVGGETDISLSRLDKNPVHLLPAPFQRGEAAHYTIRYGPLKAGIISLEVDAVADRAEPAWLFTGRAISSKLVGVFYEVDDSIESVVDLHHFVPLRLDIEVDESSEKGTRTVRYDHEMGIANYARKLTYHRRHGPSEEIREDPLEPGALDVFSGLYRLRMVKLEPGRVYELPVHDSGKNWLSHIEVGQPEIVSTGLGKIKGIPLDVEVSLKGKLAADRALRIWLSDDARRVMLRFHADLKFGSLKGVLQAYRANADAPLEGRPTALTEEEAE